MPFQVAIDGPAVSGKSSAAKHLAARLDCLYLDSGAVYRCVTLAKLRGLSLDDEGLESRLDDLRVELRPLDEGFGCSVHMAGEDVSEAIRTQEVSDNILPVSGNPRVRAWVVETLRHWAKGQSVVMDGRDIASVVFPEAEFKFYVTASVEVRAQRRLGDVDGADYSLKEMMHSIEARDEGDRGRKVGPLVQVPEATVIDNSHMNLPDTVDTMARQVLEHLEQKVG